MLSSFILSSLNSLLFSALAARSNAVGFCLVQGKIVGLNVSFEGLFDFSPPTKCALQILLFVDGSQGVLSALEKLLNV